MLEPLKVAVVLIPVALLALSAPARAELRWVPKASSESPIVAGREGNRDLYMCRVTYPRGGQTHVLLAKTWAGYDKCNVGAFHTEMLFADFEKLVGTQFKWVGSKNVGFPANAVIGGHAGDGRHLLACSAFYDNGMHPGYMNSDTNCNFGYGGDEKAENRYLVLTTENASVPHEPNAQASQEETSLLSWIGLGVVAAFCAATGGSCIAAL